MLYKIYYRLGQYFVTILSFFLFKDPAVFLQNFKELFYRKAEILATLKKGPKLWVRSFEDLMMIRSVFGEEVYKSLFVNLKEDVTFIDLGAFNGDTAIYASQVKRVRKIIAVEPLPANTKLLKKNLKVNKVKRVLLIDKAVAADSKGRNTYLTLNATIGSFLKSKERSDKIFVPTITLSTLLKLVKTKSIIIKCDIEGGEYELFLKTKKGVLNKVDRILFELHLEGIKNEKLPTQLVRHLERSGFRCVLKRNFFNPKYPMLFCSRSNMIQSRL